MSELSVVIPAAGRGSRLGFTGPKALAPLCGRTLIDFVLDAVLAEATEVVIVVSPEHRTALHDKIRARSDQRTVRMAVQPRPNGSAEAVDIGLAAASEPLRLIAWCDQVGLQAATVSDVARRLRRSRDRAIVPVTEVPAPYVWFETDGHGRFDRVGRARDGDPRPVRGLSDLGLFGVPASIRPVSASPAQGREQDFVYSLPALSQAGLLEWFPVEDKHQTLAVNTREDLIRASTVLSAVAA